jgi:tetratricopeptide (TPR) repeat protein
MPSAVTPAGSVQQLAYDRVPRMAAATLLALLLIGNHPRTLVREALDAFDAGRWDEAAERYLEAYEAAQQLGLPEKPELLYNAGLSYERGGRCDRAIALFERYVERKPNQPPSDLRDRMERARACADRMRAPEPEPREVNAVVAPAPPPPSSDGPPVMAWIAGGIGVGALAAGVTLSLLSRSAVARRDGELAKTEDEIRGLVVRNAQDDAIRFAVGAYVCLGVAAAGLITSLVLFFFDG